MHFYSAFSTAGSIASSHPSQIHGYYTTLYYTYHWRQKRRISWRREVPATCRSAACTLGALVALMALERSSRPSLHLTPRWSRHATAFYNKRILCQFKIIGRVPWYSLSKYKTRIHARSLLWLTKCTLTSFVTVVLSRSISHKTKKTHCYRTFTMVILIINQIIVILKRWYYQQKWSTFSEKFK